VFETMSMLNATRQMPATAGRAGKRTVKPGVILSATKRRPRHDTENTGSALLQGGADEREPAASVEAGQSQQRAAGVDGLDIDQTARHLKTAWPEIRDQLLQGTYRPSPVRRVTIPKPDGGERELGIPTVTDRLIQQALLQVLQPMIWTRPSANTATASDRDAGARRGSRGASLRAVGTPEDRGRC
jgi:RNA-directed DNA polymerase